MSEVVLVGFRSRETDRLLLGRSYCWFPYILLRLFNVDMFILMAKRPFEAVRECGKSH